MVFIMKIDFNYVHSYLIYSSLKERLLTWALFPWGKIKNGAAICAVFIMLAFNRFYFPFF